MQYVSGVPLQGSLYYRLQSQIASNYQGLGPHNVGRNPYAGLTGLPFQKPLSGVSPAVTTPVRTS